VEIYLNWCVYLAEEMGLGWNKIIKEFLATRQIDNRKVDRHEFSTKIGLYVQNLA